MATGRSSFAKRQRDMAKKARAEAKREKRLGRYTPDQLNSFSSKDSTDSADTPELSKSGQHGLSNAEIMAKVEKLHKSYDDGLLDLDTFDKRRASLMAQISV